MSTPSVTRPADAPSAPCRRACARTSSTGSASGGSCSSYAGATASNGIRSCSRIARRCGEVEARTSRHRRLRATQISSAGHLPRPVGRERVVVLVVGRVVGRVELDEVDDVEAGAPEQAEELAVRQLPLDADLVGPLEPAEAPLRALERLAGRRLLVGRAEDRERAVAEEPEAPAGPQQPMRLGQPAVRVAPDAGPVLGHGEVEALRRERDVLGARLDERELEPELLLAAPRRRELRRGHVDADRPRAAAGEPGGDVGRAAAELDDVEAVDVAERAERRLGDAEDAPGDLLARPRVARAARRCTRRSPSSRPRGCGARRRRGRDGHRRPSGKNSCSSRRALFRESEPWTTFSERSVARSPRIVPGAESAGFVAPISAADAGDRVLAADGEREHGPGGDEVDELAVERLASMLGVVLSPRAPSRS